MQHFGHNCQAGKECELHSNNVMGNNAQYAANNAHYAANNAQYPVNNAHYPTNNAHAHDNAYYAHNNDHLAGNHGHPAGNNFQNNGYYPTWTPQPASDSEETVSGNMPTMERPVPEHLRRHSLPASAHGGKKHTHQPKGRSKKKFPFSRRHDEGSIDSYSSVAGSTSDVTGFKSLHEPYVSINVRLTGNNHVLLPEDVFVPIHNLKTLAHIFLKALEAHPHEVGKYILRREKSVFVYGKKNQVNYAKPHASFSNISQWKPKRLIFCVRPNHEVIRELEARTPHEIRVNAREKADSDTILDQDIMLEGVGTNTVNELWESLASENFELRNYGAVALLTKRPSDSLFVRFGLNDKLIDVVNSKGHRFFFLVRPKNELNDSFFGLKGKDKDKQSDERPERKSNHHDNPHVCRHGNVHDNRKNRRQRHYHHHKTQQHKTPQSRTKRSHSTGNRNHAQETNPAYHVRFNPFFRFRKSAGDQVSKTAN